MDKYEVEYIMNGQSRQKIVIEVGGSQAERNTVKSMMGPHCENASSGILKKINF